MSKPLQSGQQPGTSGRFPQPSGHPDADQLSAFLDHALPAHERGQVLAHLAICPDCRETVALSLPAAEAPLAPAARPERKRWFRPGSIVVLPAATALAAAALFVVYLHRPPAGPPNGHARMAASQPAAADGQSAAAVAAAPPPQSPSAGPALRAPRQSLAPPTAATAQTALGRAPLLPEKRQAMSFNAPPRQTASSPAPSFGEGAGMGLGAGAAPRYGTLAAPAPAAEAAPGANALSAPPNAEKPVAGTSPGAPATAAAINIGSPSAAESIQVLNPPSLAAAPAETKSLDLVSSEIPAPVLPVALPSRLGVLSSARNGVRVLAIDAHNAVFLSADSGRHWKPVQAAWPGRAVKASLVVQGAPRGQAMGALLGGANIASLASGSRQRAGQANASLTGTVTDPSGAAISGATVAVTDAATSAAHTVKTGPDGRYLAGGLVPGAYNLRAQAPGFQIQYLHGIVIDASRANVANLKLNVGSAAESVTVDAGDEESKVSSARFSALPPAAAFPPNPVFEITTDTGARWTSRDGLTWKHD